MGLTHGDNLQDWGVGSHTCRIAIIMLCALSLSGLNADPILPNTEYQKAYVLKGCYLRKCPYEDTWWKFVSILPSNKYISKCWGIDTCNFERQRRNHWYSSANPFTFRWKLTRVFWLQSSGIPLYPWYHSDHTLSINKLRMSNIWHLSRHYLTSPCHI